MENMVEKTIVKTKAWAVKMGYVKTSLGDKDEKVELTPEQNRVVAAMRISTFGCQVTDVIRIVSAIMNIDPKLLHTKDKKNEDDVEYEKGIMIVPLGNNNDHDYEIKVPCLCIDPDNGNFLRMDGTTGNSLTTTKKLVRPATEEEIKEFFDNFLDNLVD